MSQPQAGTGWLARLFPVALALLGLAVLVLLVSPGSVRQALSAGPLLLAGSGPLRLASSLPDREALAFVAALEGALQGGAEGKALVTTSTSTPRAAMEQLAKGEADLALVSTLLGENDSALAVQVRVAGAAGVRLAHVITPADSVVRAFDSLAGKRLGVGLRGSSEDALARKLVEATQLNPPPELVTAHNLDLEQAFLDGEIDAALLLRPVASPDVSALMATGYYRLLAAPAGAATAWAAPGAFATAIPARTYATPDTAEAAAIPTLGEPVLVLCRANLSSARVARVVDALDVTLARGGAAAKGDAALALASLPVGLALHPAAAGMHSALGQATGRQVSDLALFCAGLAGAGVLLWMLVRYRLMRAEAAHDALLMELIGRSRRLEAVFATETSQEAVTEARRQLAALDDEAELAWLSRRITADELLILRLGWGADLPERTIEEIRARAERVVPVAAEQETNKTSFLARAVAAAAATRPEVPAVRPAAVEASPVAPAPGPIAKRRLRDDDFVDDDFRPSLRPIVRDEEPEAAFAPEPAARTWDPVPRDAFEEPAEFGMEEPERASRFTMYTPIDAFEGNDEFGSGVMLNTIRVRRGDDAPPPAEEMAEPTPAPAPEPEPLPTQKPVAAKEKNRNKSGKPQKPQALPPTKAAPAKESPTTEDAPTKPQLRLF
jgi:TRAP-type uncharacterized transport system substrate-binding protein